jgi:hypothetical protein
LLKRKRGELLNVIPEDKEEYDETPKATPLRKVWNISSF